MLSRASVLVSFSCSQSPAHDTCCAPSRCVPPFPPNIAASISFKPSQRGWVAKQSAFLLSLDHYSARPPKLLCCAERFLSLTECRRWLWIICFTTFPSSFLF